MIVEQKKKKKKKPEYQIISTWRVRAWPLPPDPAMVPDYGTAREKFKPSVDHWPALRVVGCCADRAKYLLFYVQVDRRTMI
jgi:hypothetical protein